MIFKLNKKIASVMGLTLLLIAGAFVSLVMGSYQLSIGEVFAIVKFKIFGGDETLIQKLHAVIVWNVRSPRIVLVIISGIAFSVSGTAYQACFRNPLVEPYILGVSAGASFGAAMGILFPAIVPSIQLSAFIFALVAVSLSYSITLTRGKTPVIALVISGVVIASLFSALVSLLKYIAPDAQLREITFWMMGGFYYATWDDVLLSAPIVAVIFIVVFVLSWKLNILSMGDEEARSLGVNPEKYRILFIVISTLATSLCVSQVGIVSWVGLMSPHAARMLFGADNTYVIPAGCVLGALFLLLCDTLARTISGSEIPIGIITSILGAPFLIYLLRSKGAAVYG
jgi:iron complex transport system permease protein